MTSSRPLLLAAAAALCLGTLPACSGDGDAGAAPSASASARTTSAPASASSSASAGASPSVTASPSASAEASASSPPSARASSSATPSSASPTPSASSRPSASSPAPRAGAGLPSQYVDARQGEDVWAVYLGTFASEQEAPVEPFAQAQRVGYEPGVSQVACDGGAAQALGVDEGAGLLAVSLLFRTEADARAAATALGEPRPVVAPVTAFCLD